MGHVLSDVFSKQALSSFQLRLQNKVAELEGFDGPASLKKLVEKHAK
jgi:hypothetical protein